MGKLTLKDVEFIIDVSEGRDYRRKLDICGDTLKQLKDIGNNFRNEIAEEFSVDVSNVDIKGAGLSQNRFVVF